MIELIQCKNEVDAAELVARPHAEIVSPNELKELLVSPVDHKKLYETSDGLSDGENFYPVINGEPILYPAEIYQSLTKAKDGFLKPESTLQQYFLLSQIKQQGEINASSTNVHYKRHLYRMSMLLGYCDGLTLDVGCDDINIGSSLLPSSGKYVGLDPFSESANINRVVGIGECLPFKAECFDNVMFNTSLDHILDYYLGLSEAKRVLKKGGQLHLATLLWVGNSTLLTDAVHFHHFKEYEIIGALESLGFSIGNNYKYSYKNDEHRYGWYLTAVKL